MLSEARKNRTASKEVQHGSCLVCFTIPLDQLALVRNCAILRKWAFTWLEARGLFGERTKDLLYVAVLGRRITDQARACSYCKRLTHPDIGTFSSPAFCSPAGWSIVRCQNSDLRRSFLRPYGGKSSLSLCEDISNRRMFMAVLVSPFHRDRVWWCSR